MSVLSTHTLMDDEVQQDPTAYHHALQAQPLFYDDRLGFWICSTYRLMREILRNTRVFSNVGSQSMDAIVDPPADVRAVREQMLPTVDTMVTNDPPEHTRIRQCMDPPFRPRSVMAMTDRLRVIVDDCIDDFISAGECEFVSAFATPVPILVIADMLGVPRRLASDIKAWSDAFVEPLGMMITPERHVACVRLQKAFQDFFVPEFEARRREPRHDLLTDMVQARLPDGQRFSTA